MARRPTAPASFPDVDDVDMSPGLRELARRGEPRRYRRGTLLIQEGDRGDLIYVVLQGRVRAFAAHPVNQREITFGIYGAGDYVGEMGLDGGPRSANVEVIDDAACSVVSRGTLERHIAEHPQFAFELFARLIRRVRAATLSTKQLALIDVYGRLKWRLESIARRQPDGSAIVEEPLTHLELAQQLGCTREMVSRVLKEVEQGGYLRRDGRRLVLLKPLPAGY